VFALQGVLPIRLFAVTGKKNGSSPDFFAWDNEKEPPRKEESPPERMHAPPD
jgi:hypothetical protein